MGEIITANRANNINFNLVIDRRNTNCLKYDFAVRRGKTGECIAALGC